LDVCMVSKSMVKTRTFGDWPMAHIVPLGETWALCGIAPATGWDNIRDYSKPICRHCNRRMQFDAVQVELATEENN
jgi:rubredoxin